MYLANEGGCNTTFNQAAKKLFPNQKRAWISLCKLSQEIELGLKMPTHTA
jgi:hypothetical protein